MSNEHHESLGAAIESAAGSLPEGYQVVISIEKEGYDVKLSQPNDLCVSVEGESLIADIEELTAIAVSKEGVINV